MSVLPKFGMTRPTTVEEAVGLLSFDDMPLGGGTELLLAMRMRMLQPDSLVNLKGIPELGEVTVEDDHLVIGGGVTHDAAARHDLVQTNLPLLSEVLDQVGNPRVRASGTLAGNLVFAEPKSDVIPILYALDATVTLQSPNGVRSSTIDEFILGPYYAAREPDEIVTAIRIPLGRLIRGVYLKYQTMERPTVGVAALDITTDGGVERRIVVGAVTERPHRFSFSTDDTIDGHAIAADLEPIADIAGGVPYKRHVTGVFIDRAVAQLVEST